MTPQWRELTRCDSLAEAHLIATSIEAMEFEVRLRSASADEPLAAAAGPFVVEARAEDRDDLAGVLEEILAEQGEFDERLERRDRAIECTRRGFFLVAIAGALAVEAYLWLRGA